MFRIFVASIVFAVSVGREANAAEVLAGVFAACCCLTDSHRRSLSNGRSRGQAVVATRIETMTR
jgi:hypothetical protein